jgi:hypothetical protein
MGRTFQRIHASIAGKFDGNLRDKIPQWIRANGGQFSRDVNLSVTHLIATKQAYKENAPLGRHDSFGHVRAKLIDSIQSTMPKC